MAILRGYYVRTYNTPPNIAVRRRDKGTLQYNHTDALAYNGVKRHNELSQFIREYRYHIPSFSQLCPIATHKSIQLKVSTTLT